MIAIIIPAHNEEDYLEQCLIAAKKAASYSARGGEKVHILVVLDTCIDQSEAIAKRLEIETIHVYAQNVGYARAVGAELMISRGARWLAFTDADTIVSETWLYTQLSLGKEAVCGSIEVLDWTPYGEHAAIIRHHFNNHYFDEDNHRHIHGANFGVSVKAYLQAGGFPSLSCSEDVALVNALISNDIEIAWSAAPRVKTSARRDARARGGFGDTLAKALKIPVGQANLISE